METLDYSIIINAPIQKVWNLLWNQESYSQWTRFFDEGSTLKSDWQVGGKTYFLDKTGNGMVSTIMSLNEPNEVIFRHLGTFQNGVEDTKSREVMEWSGTEEKYFLRAIDETTTELRAITHTMQEYKEYMDNGFNKGFAFLKNLAES
ncbi:SRPBCC family protein [Chryseobacterium sp. R2A-55]|uniref:SRPBCC family protein n=1 Tax=Chryseobacterium sp. R2A-55 TaxID=2744445 RepID=UPI001F419764|nr:SRPBCC domain-containing protein [Chryseobacterium sp. R2A-55]